MTLPESAARRLWSRLYGSTYVDGDRQRLLQALPVPAGLQTFLWLYPASQPRVERRQWRLVHAQLLQQAGQGAQARADLQALQAELRAEHSGGRFVDAVNQLLAQL